MIASNWNGTGLWKMLFLLSISTNRIDFLFLNSKISVCGRLYFYSWLSYRIAMFRFLIIICMDSFDCILLSIFFLTKLITFLFLR